MAERDGATANIMHEAVGRGGEARQRHDDAEEEERGGLGDGGMPSMRMVVPWPPRSASANAHAHASASASASVRKWLRESDECACCMRPDACTPVRGHRKLRERIDIANAHGPTDKSTGGRDEGGPSAGCAGCVAIGVALGCCSKSGT